MKRIALILAAVLALVTDASPAFARDLCISFSALSGLVGKDFRLPPRGKCKPFNGFTPDAMAVGTGCTTPDGQLLRLHFTAHDADFDVSISGACNFVLPAMTTGNCRIKAAGTSNDFSDTSGPATAAFCTANVP